MHANFTVLKAKHLASVVKGTLSSELPDNEALSPLQLLGEQEVEEKEVPAVSDTIKALSSIPELALFLICDMSWSTRACAASNLVLLFPWHQPVL